jgi:cytochrome c oxidase subunit I+III
MTAEESRLRDAWRIPSGWRYWSSVNNTVVGLWYVGLTLLFFLFGGGLALLMRLQLARSENDFLSADRYNQIFTYRRSARARSTSR